MNDTGAAIVLMIADVQDKLERARKAGAMPATLYRMATDTMTFLEAPRSTIESDPALGLEERVAIRKAISECEEAAKRLLADDMDRTETSYDRTQEHRRIAKVRDGYRRQR